MLNVITDVIEPVWAALPMPHKVAMVCVIGTIWVVELGFPQVKSSWFLFPLLPIFWAGAGTERPVDLDRTKGKAIAHSPGTIPHVSRPYGSYSHHLEPLTTSCGGAQTTCSSSSSPSRLASNSDLARSPRPRLRQALCHR